ncbi:WD40-repeat-containing domain protein [Cunninghamella echinulata]|nr:WD40-repeat-containing domain protein [Cunninghamella echinulata]
MVFKGHLDSVRSVAFHPDELLVASGSDDGTIKIIKLQGALGDGQTVKKPHEDLDAMTTYRGHHNIITHLAISSEQKRVYSSSLDSTIRVWRLPTEQNGPFSPVDPSLYITTFIGHTDAIWDFKLSPNSSLLASAAADGKIKVWDTEGSDQLLKRSWDYDGVFEDNHDINIQSNNRISPTCVDFCRTDPSKLIVSYNNAKIRLFDIETGKLILTFTGSDETYDNTCRTQINKIVSHPTTPLVISGHEDRYIKFYDTNSGKSTFSMSGHLDAVTCLDMDPSGMSFVSGGHDSSIRLWDLAMTKTCIQEFSAHRKKGDEGVLGVQYHPSYPWMVSGGADGIVKIYNHGH